MKATILAMALVFCGFAGEEKNKFDPWESWSAYKEGTAIEFEMEVSSMKTQMTKTLDKKEKDEITIKVETVVKIGGFESKTPSEEKVRRDGDAGKAATTCPLCNKPIKDHKDEGKWSEEKLKVGDKELLCKKYETPEKMCNGNPMPKSTIWYCKDVPGCMVKMKTDMMTMTMTKFDAKK